MGARGWSIACLGLAMAACSRAGFDHAVAQFGGGDAILSGDTNWGDTNRGDTRGGDVSTGDDRNGDTSRGDLAAGDLNQGDTVAGDTAPSIWTFGISGNRSIAQTQCAPYGVVREAASPPSTPAITATVTATGSATLHQSPTCGDSPRTSFVMGAGVNTITVYLSGVAVEQVTLRADANPGNPGSLDVFVLPPTLTVTPTYAAAPDWNQYIQNNVPGTDIHHQPGALCTGAETGTMPVCLHGGEMRRVLTTQPSCAGLSLQDTLDEFEWTCFDEATAVFYSIGLTGDLSDLISAAGWRNNQVILSVSDVPTAASLPAQWWGNAITPLPPISTSALVPLTNPDIYVATTFEVGCGFQIQVDGAAIVSPEGAVARAGDATACGGDTAFVGSSGANFIWIEGGFDGGSLVLMTVRLASTAHSVLRGVDAQGGQSAAVGLADSDHNRVEEIAAFNSGSGLTIGAGSDGNVAKLVRAWNNLGQGVDVQMSTDNAVGDSAAWLNAGQGFSVSGSPDTRLHRIVASANGANGMIISMSARARVHSARLFNNAARGLVLTGSADSTVVGVHASHNQQGGISLGTGADRATLSHVTAMSNLNAGIGVAANDATLVQMVAMNNDMGISLAMVSNTAMQSMAIANNGIGINVQSGGGNVIDGFVVFGGNGSDCTVVGVANPDIADITCAGMGQVLVARDLSATFSEHVTTTDFENSTNIAGAAMYAVISDWTHFNNEHRMWGLDGSSFPTSAPRGVCSIGQCRIWDWRIRATDIVLLNHSGDPATPNAPWLPTCPGAADIGRPDQQTVPNNFLINAVEVPGQPGGDDDGLCEDGESCLFSPNLGAYQGHGGVDNGLCNYTGVFLGSVSLARASSNGAP